MHAALDPADLSYEIVRYAHVDPMPEELRRVIQCYFSAKSGELSTLSGPTVGFKRFKEAVQKLHDRVQQFRVDEPKPSDDVSDRAA
jgi:hypothetical protein